MTFHLHLIHYTYFFDIPTNFPTLGGQILVCMVYNLDANISSEWLCIILWHLKVIRLSLIKYCAYSMLMQLWILMQILNNTVQSDKKVKKVLT